MCHFNRKVGSYFDGSECFSITVIKYELTDPSDIITAYLLIQVHKTLHSRIAQQNIIGLFMKNMKGPPNEIW